MLCTTYARNKSHSSAYGGAIPVDKINRVKQTFENVNNSARCVRGGEDMGGIRAESREDFTIPRLIVGIGAVPSNYLTLVGKSEKVTCRLNSGKRSQLHQLNRGGAA